MLTRHATRCTPVVRAQVSLDYYIQGFCLSSLTLRPSAFYAAAGLRTTAVRAAIWHAVRANMSADAVAAAPGCVTVVGGRSLGGHHPPPLDVCQEQICRLTDCNLNQ
jgi:hypothetical protein